MTLEICTSVQSFVRIATERSTNPSKVLLAALGAAQHKIENGNSCSNQRQCYGQLAKVQSPKTRRAVWTFVHDKWDDE